VKSNHKHNANNPTLSMNHERRFKFWLNGTGTSHFTNNRMLIIRNRITVKQGNLTEREGSVQLTSCTELFRSAPFYVENIVNIFNKTSYLNEEVNCAEPPPSVSYPWVKCLCEQSWANRGQCYKTFLRPYVTNFCNKLECLLLASLPSLVYYLWARPWAYNTVEHLKGSSIG
jgi:hypothetical protein